MLQIADVAASDFPEAPAAAKAAADALNKSGGIAGHPVSIDYCNYKYDPNQLVSCTRKLISDGVVAVIGSLILTSAEPYSLLKSAGIPLVGTFVTNSNDYTSTDSFPLDGGSLATSGLGPVTVLKAIKNITSFSSVIYTNPESTAIANLAAKNAGCAGIKYTGTIGEPLTATDFSPYASQLKQKGAEGAGFPATPAQISGTVIAAAQLGVKTHMAIPEQSLDPTTIKNVGSATTDATGVLNYPPLSAAAKFPAIAQYKADMSAAGAPDKYLTPVAFRSWLAVQAIGAVVKNVSGDLTHASLLSALNTGKDIDLLGLLKWSPSGTGPTEFPRLTNLNVYAAKVENGQVVLAQDAPIPAWAC